MVNARKEIPSSALCIDKYSMMSNYQGNAKSEYIGGFNTQLQTLTGIRSLK